MSSIVRPSPAQKTRRIVVLAAALFAVVVPLIQNTTGWGLSQAEFAQDGNSTLRVEGYAFSIWGLLYFGILAYAIRQVLPSTGETAVINRLGWPSAVSFIGIGIWIVAAALNLKVASVLVIFASLLALLVPLLVYARPVRHLSAMEQDRTMVVWPLAALAGWLTVAAPLNLITTLTANDALAAGLSPTGWAVTAIVGVTIVALLVTYTLRTLAYPIPVMWGLIGAFVAEQPEKPVVAFSALGAALVVIVLGVIMVFRLHSGVERAN